MRLIDNKVYLKFKSIQVLSNGSLFFNKSNYIKYTFIEILEKDSKNFEFNKKKNSKIKSKSFSNHKAKYILYK